jgi:hypothetical protein
MNTQFVGAWKEMVVLYLKVTFGHLPGEIEGNHKRPFVTVTCVLVNIRNGQAYKLQI